MDLHHRPTSTLNSHSVEQITRIQGWSSITASYTLILRPNHEAVGGVRISTQHPQVDERFADKADESLTELKGNPI